MIRLLQSRLNDDTVEVDTGRPKRRSLPPALRREIEALKASQEEIRDTLRRVGAPWKPARTPSPRESSIDERRIPSGRAGPRAFGWVKNDACVRRTVPWSGIQSNRR